MDKISINLPGKKEYLPSLRLFAASLANSQGFNIEEVEDFKLVVSEAMNYKIPSDKVSVDFYPKKGEIDVEVKGPDRDLSPMGLKMRNLILNELASKVCIGENFIKFTKEAQDDFEEV